MPTDVIERKMIRGYEEGDACGDVGVEFVA